MPICELHEAIQRTQSAQERELGGLQANMKSLLQNQDILFHEIKSLRETEIASLQESIEEIKASTIHLSALYGNGWQKSIESRAQTLENNISDIVDEMRQHVQQTSKQLFDLHSTTWFGRTITDFKDNMAARTVQVIAGIIILKVLAIVIDFADLNLLSSATAIFIK
jgi:predicted  nucleic acid-binding Zn-ribbon protein